MKNSVILQDKDENEMHLLLHPFTRERKKTQKKTKTQKNAKKRKRIFSRTKTHILKNEDAKKNENEDATSRRTMST